MDLIHLALASLNKNMGFSLFVGKTDSPTILDLMLFSELEQVLFMYNYYKQHSRSQLFSDLRKAHPDAAETDELLEFENIEKWFNRTMSNDPSVSKAAKNLSA